MMSGLSRRTALKGALGAAALPAVAVIADGAVLAFGPELDRLVAEYQVALAAFNRAENAIADAASNRGVPWDVVKDEMGFDEIDARVDERCDAMTNCLHRLADTPAGTLEGLKFKARYAEHADVLEGSIVDDLLRMQGLLRA